MTKLYYLFIHVHNVLYLKVFSQCQKQTNGKTCFRILLPFLINILVPQIWLLFVMSSALQYIIQWSVMVCLRSMLHECIKSSITQQRKYITLLNNPKFFRELMLWIFKHITEDMVRITLASTHFRNLFSGKEGDLPVGFPDRFNSSSISFWMRFRQVLLCRYQFKVIFDECFMTLL